MRLILCQGYLEFIISLFDFQSLDFLLSFEALLCILELFMVCGGELVSFLIDAVHQCSGDIVGGCGMPKLNGKPCFLFSVPSCSVCSFRVKRGPTSLSAQVLPSSPNS